MYLMKFVLHFSNVSAENSFQLFLTRHVVLETAMTTLVIGQPPFCQNTKCKVYTDVLKKCPNFKFE